MITCFILYCIPFKIHHFGGVSVSQKRMHILITLRIYSVVNTKNKTLSHILDGTFEQFSIFSLSGYVVFHSLFYHLSSLTTLLSHLHKIKLHAITLSQESRKTDHPASPLHISTHIPHHPPSPLSAAASIYQSNPTPRCRPCPLSSHTSLLGCFLQPLTLTSKHTCYTDDGNKPRSEPHRTDSPN